jgi:biopolymer transport protein ExbB
MNEHIFTVAHFADKGVMILLFSLCILSLIMIIERYFYLRKVLKSSKLNQVILERAITERNLSQIKEIAKNSTSLEARAISYALEQAEISGENGLVEIFSSVAQLEKPKLERSLGFLATVGSNAPYIGLFGTVLGIMKAFHDMGTAGEGGQGAVMAGISSALIATAAGLMVAIPAVLAFNYFQKQVKFILANVDTSRDITLAWLKQGGGR